MPKDPPYPPCPPYPPFQINTIDNKYTIVQEENGENNVKILRYGESWSGPGERVKYSNMILSLAREIKELRNQIESDHNLSDAYLRLRALIPGAFDTPHAPSPKQVWETTETSLKRLLKKANKET